MPKKIVITGASGLIGTNLARVLINRGDYVYILTRDAKKTKMIIPGATDYFNWDYKNPDTWAEYLNNKDTIQHT